MDDIISYDEYQALSDEEKQNYIPDWNKDGKSGSAKRKGAKLPEVKPLTPTAEIKQDNKPSKKGTKPEGYTEARTKDAKEDIEQGRDYKNAKALSAYERYLKERNFSAKDISGNYVFSYKKLGEMRNEARKNGDTEREAALQKEINNRPEGKAEITENKKKAEAAKTKAATETDAKAKAYAEANKGTKSDGSGSALKDTSGQDKALAKKEEALDKVLDKSKTRREELDEEWDKLLADNEAELDKHKDAAELANFLPRFAIQHYLEGNFGKRGSAKAIGTLGYFLLDKIGASLVNASLVARGMSPTQKTALEQYNAKMMDAAINRDDRNRTKINEEKVNTIIKNSDALRKAGFDTDITLGNDMASKYLSQHADQIDEQVYLKLKKQAADWYNNLSDSDKMSVDRLFLAMSTNPSERQKGILQYQLKGYEANAQEDTARAEIAKYQQAEAKAKTKVVGKLTKAQLNRAETEIENMKKNGLLTDAQTADAWKIVDIHQKDLNWRDAQEWQKQITGYLKPATEAIDAVTPF